jgi:hypothetical protein
MTNEETNTNEGALSPQGAPVAPERPSSKKRASPAKSAPKGQKAATAGKVGKGGKQARKSSAQVNKAKRTEEAGARQGSKTAKVLDLLKSQGGATIKELMKATGWQPHSVRGFLSGTVGKKMALVVTSTKNDDGERIYAVKN